jgi:hypothetical protein
MKKTEWHKRLAAFKKYYNYKNADLARMSGNTLQSVKNISQGEVPGWLKFAIQVHEKNTFEGALHYFLEKHELLLFHAETSAYIETGWKVRDYNFRYEKEFETLASAIKSARQR